MAERLLNPSDTFAPAPSVSAQPSDRPAPRARTNEGPPLFDSLGSDLLAGLVVFLVALPLCLGVALASRVPPLSGLIAGCIGGMIVPLVSRASLSVSGPAAGLAAIIAAGVSHYGIEGIFAATAIAGMLQLALGSVRAGGIVAFVPTSVIRGMLVAIGVLLVLKQVPHAIGYDAENFAGMSFAVASDGNTFTLLVHALRRLEWGALLVSVCAAGVFALWSRLPGLKRVAWLPAALVAVVLGTTLSVLFSRFAPSLALEPRHLVQVPTGGPSGIRAGMQLPTMGAFMRPAVWLFGLQIAIVASLETLLSLDAIDKLDPLHRRSNPDRELLAQGAANLASGLLGGLPITSVIVRSSANVNAGGRTRIATFTHGALLLASVVFAAGLLNHIPLAVLATVLVVTGLKLASPSVFRAMYRRGPAQFVPFIVTVVAIVFSDLLRGLFVGLIVGQIFSIRSAIANAFEVHDEGPTRTVRFVKDVFFFHRATLLRALEDLPEGTTRVVVDRGLADHVSHDVLEAVSERKIDLEHRGVHLEFHGLTAIEPMAH